MAFYLPRNSATEILENMVKISQIRKYALALARQFNPERVILFGSYASQKQGPDSDVDLLVVMECPGDPSQKAIELRLAVPRPNSRPGAATSGSGGHVYRHNS